MKIYLNNIIKKTVFIYKGGNQYIYSFFVLSRASDNIIDRMEK